MIVKRNDGYHVVSEKGKNLGGPYGSHEEAQARLNQVEKFKHMNKSVQLISLDEAWQQFSLSKSRTHGARDRKKRDKKQFYNRYEKLKGKMSEGSAFSKVKLGK